MNMSFKEKYCNFWYEDMPRKNYCLLRVLTGFILCMRLCGVWGIYRINNLPFKFPIKRFASESSYMLEAFRFPIPLFEWLPVPSFFFYRLIFEWGMLFLAILFTIGLFVRIVAPVLTVTLLYWTLLSQFFYYHHMATFLLVFLVMGFTNCWQYYSLDSYLFKKKAANKRYPILPIRLLQVFISIIYFFSLLAKLNSAWFQGEVLESMHYIGSIKGIFSPIIFKYVSFRALSLFTIFAEAFLIFGLWHKKTRFLAMLIGFMFHIGIDATMGVATFSYQILALYIIFMPPTFFFTVSTLSQRVRAT